MYVVRIDGKGGSFFESKAEAERELKRFGFMPNAMGYEKLLFNGKGCRVMTARIEEVIS